MEPSDGASFVRGLIEVYGIASGADGVSLTLTLDTLPPLTLAIDEAAFHFSLNTSSLALGEHTITVVATDDIGASTTATALIRLYLKEDQAVDVIPNGDTIPPAVAVFPATAGPLASDAPITVTIAGTVAATNVELSGTLAMFTRADATSSIVLTPSSFWPLGAGQTLIVTTNGHANIFVFDVFAQDARQTVYVRAVSDADLLGGNDSPNCSDPWAPCASIAHALSTLTGEANVLVAGGAYEGFAITLDRVSVYGGYARTAWDERDSILHKTSVTTAQTEYGMESTFRCFSSDVSRETVVDGLFFTNLTPEALAEQAIVHLYECDLTFRNNDVLMTNTVMANHGIYLQKSAPLIARANIHSQQASNGPGYAVRIISAVEGAVLDIEKSTITFADLPASTVPTSGVSMLDVQPVEVRDSVINMGNAVIDSEGPSDRYAIVGPGTKLGDVRALRNTIWMGDQTGSAQGRDVVGIVYAKTASANTITLGNLGTWYGYGIADSESCTSNTVYQGKAAISIGIFNCANISGTDAAPTRIHSGSSATNLGISLRFPHFLLPPPTTIDHVVMRKGLGMDPFSAGIRLGMSCEGTPEVCTGDDATVTATDIQDTNYGIYADQAEHLTLSQSTIVASAAGVYASDTNRISINANTITAPLPLQVFAISREPTSFVVSDNALIDSTTTP